MIINKTEYTFKEFEKLFNNGYFKFDNKNHPISEDEMKELLNQNLIRTKKLVVRLSESGNNINSHPIGIGQPIMLLSGYVDYKCSHICGENFYLGITEENTISLYRMEGDYGTDKNLKFIHDEKCECLDFKNQKATYKFEDEIIFTNVFRNKNREYLLEDSPKDKEYTPEFDLCSIKGKGSITKYKSETQNVAFGSMSNMSISIYSNKERTHFIVTSPYLEDMDTERASKTIDYLKEYDNLGDISLNIWRWEATDRKTFNSIDNSCEIDDMIYSPIKSGEWEMIHYFDGNNFGYNFNEPDSKTELEIYSELKLK